MPPRPHVGQRGKRSRRHSRCTFHVLLPTVSQEAGAWPHQTPTHPTASPKRRWCLPLMMSEIDDLTALLTWLHERLGNCFSIDMEGRGLDTVILRGREPSYRFPDEDPESYVIDVFTRVESIPIDREVMRNFEILDNGEMIRLTFNHGAHVEILNKGESRGAGTRTCTHNQRVSAPSGQALGQLCRSEPRLISKVVQVESCPLGGGEPRITAIGLATVDQFLTGKTNQELPSCSSGTTIQLVVTRITRSRCRSGLPRKRSGRSSIPPSTYKVVPVM